MCWVKSTGKNFYNHGIYSRVLKILRKRWKKSMQIYCKTPRFSFPHSQSFSSLCNNNIIWKTYGEHWQRESSFKTVKNPGTHLTVKSAKQNQSRCRHSSKSRQGVIFASKRNKAKRNSSVVFRFFSLFSLFFALFRLIFVSLRLFRLLFAYLSFVFASDFWCFASKWIMWNQAFFCFQAKRNFHFNFKFRFRSESEGAP